jgi:hypothetical protein
MSVTRPGATNLRLQSLATAANTGDVPPLGAEAVTWMVTMHASMKFFVVAASALSLSATTVSLPGTARAQANGFPTGPMGGCPAGYHPGPADRRCWLNAGPAANGFPTGPMGGCPAGYHPGPADRRCWLNCDPHSSRIPQRLKAQIPARLAGI